MSDVELFEELERAARAGRLLALATVVRTRGSVPRHAGSRMLVDGGGWAMGTIGGGCGEADVVAVAGEVLRSGRARLVRVELTDDADSWSPAVCGGFMDVFVEPVRES
jgi:xanthine/CO dehydrogenase XdhC/CoxF family maturation factor